MIRAQNQCYQILMIFVPILAPALCPYFMSVSRRTCTCTTTQKRAILMALYENKLLIPVIFYVILFCSSNNVDFIINIFLSKSQCLCQYGNYIVIVRAALAQYRKDTRTRNMWVFGNTITLYLSYWDITTYSKARTRFQIDTYLLAKRYHLSLHYILLSDQIALKGVGGESKLCTYVHM